MGASAERVLYRASPAMFRQRPIWFMIWCGMLLAFVVPDYWPLSVLALLVLTLWWWRCKGQTITITNQRTTLRKGILAKSTSEVWHSDVRNVQLQQSFLQRIFNVGQLALSSSGQGDVEIEIAGIRQPVKAKTVIDQHRR